MPVDIAPRALVPLREAAGPELERVTRATLVGWIKRGVRLPCGRTLRMSATRVAGRWMCDSDAVKNFLSAVATANDGPVADPAPDQGARTARRRKAGGRSGR